MSTEAEAQEKVFKYWFKKSTTKGHEHKNARARGAYIAKRIYLTVTKRAKNENSENKLSRTEAITNYEQIDENVKKIANEIAKIMIKIVKKIIRDSEIKEDTLTNLGKQINNLIKSNKVNAYLRKNKLPMFTVTNITADHIKEALGKETNKEDVSINSIFYKKGDPRQQLRSPGDAVISYIKLNYKKGEEQESINDEKVTEIINKVQQLAKDNNLKGFNNIHFVKSSFIQCLRLRRTKESHEIFLPNVKISDERQNRKQFFKTSRNTNKENKNTQINKNADEKQPKKPNIKKENSKTQKKNFSAKQTQKPKQNLTETNKQVEIFNGISEDTVIAILAHKPYTLTVDDICTLLTFLSGSRTLNTSRDDSIESTISEWWETNENKLTKKTKMSLCHTLYRYPNLSINDFTSKTCKAMVTQITKL